MTDYSNIRFNNKEIKEKILTNILLMIRRRNRLDDNIQNMLSKIKNKDDTIINFEFLDSKYSINIINSKMTSVTSKSPLDEYLNKNINIKKIVVIKDPSKRVIKQIINIYKNSEFFYFHELIDDITKKLFISKHILLTDEEKEILNTKIKIKELSIILDTDMMSRYYKAQKNDVFRILRPNLTSGNSITYRLVRPGKIDLIYIN